MIGVRPQLGLGTAPLANLFSVVSDSVARATIDAAWDRGIRFFDTAPQYGHGLGELRLGGALAERPRDEYIVSSKAGRLLRHHRGSRPPSVFVDVPDVDPTFDFTASGIRRSIEESLQRLGIDRLDVVHLHDPDDHEVIALEESFPELLRMRDEGVVGKVGCGMNQWQMLSRFVERVPLDCILLAGRWTLLDRSGASLLELCADRGVDVILGGVFNSGLLANPNGGATFDYVEAPTALIARVQRIGQVCAEFGISVPLAAVQFAVRHRAVSTVLFGARTPAELEADVEFATQTVPDEMWDALDAVIEFG